jgi:hypothetical protein
MWIPGQRLLSSYFFFFQWVSTDCELQVVSIFERQRTVLV